MHEETAGNAISRASMNRREEKMAKKRQKGKLAEEMSKITNKAIEAQQDEKMKTRRKEEIKNREEGRERSVIIIKELPARIKEAAKKGKTSVYESYENDCEYSSRYGGYMFGYIESWAEEQGFETKLKHNIEPMNEGGNSWNSLTISWE